MDINQDVNPKGEKKLLKDIRKELGLSQEQLAVYLDWDRTDLSRLETGKRIPDWIVRAIKLNQLLEKAGYSLSDLDLPHSPNDQKKP